jgi:hypothetical protein
MFDDVGYVNVRPINSGCGQGPIQDSTGRSNEWTALQVFFVSGLLAYHHHSGIGDSLAKDSLGAKLP